MNNQRRKAIQAILDELESLKESLEGIKEQEEEALENMPDNLKEGERATLSAAAIDEMDTALSSFEDIISSLTEISGQ